jgi:2-hydroxy-6-oxonona-2,4-dienedioate hydrolase
MVWREWCPPDAPASATVVLFHGGAGAWTHWYRNIESLSQRYRVLAPDLPGLGESDHVCEPYTVQDAVAPTAAALSELCSVHEPLHLLAFSWGCSVASGVAREISRSSRRANLRSMLLIGPAGLGEVPRGAMTPLLRRVAAMSRTDELALHRENLARLMVYDRAKIDDQAVELQFINANRARFFSPGFARQTAVRDALVHTQAPLKVIYGAHDAPVAPHFDARETVLRNARADLEFEVIPGVGHWLPFEWPDFNSYAHAWMEQHNVMATR